MPSFLYPSLISLTRPNPDAAIGARPYGGVQEADETTLATVIPAHIEADRQGAAPTAKLPADAAGEATWKVIFRGAPGLAKTGDVLTDDLGNRYQVISADWGPLVTTCRCQILQA